MDEKKLSDFIIHLNRYCKMGKVYYQKGYSRHYSEKEIINHFMKKYDRK